MTRVHAGATRLLIVLAVAGTVHAVRAEAQQPGRPTGDTVQVLQRFSGTTGVRIAGAVQQVKVDVRNWTVWERQKIDSLAIPLKGTSVVEVLGGTLMVTAGGRKTSYGPGRFFTLEPGQRVSLETGNDAVSFRTVTVARE